MAIHRVVLLVVLYCADNLPVGLDDEAFVCLYELLADLFDIIGAPPPGDFGFVADLKKPVGVLGAAAPQQHAPSSQNDHIDPTPFRNAPCSRRCPWLKMLKPFSNVSAA
jgi:hypothetical protein